MSLANLTVSITYKDGKKEVFENVVDFDVFSGVREIKEESKLTGSMWIERSVGEAARIDRLFDIKEFTVGVDE